MTHQVPLNSRGLPKAQGLYDPANEHDACGIGFLANIKGKKSHKIVQQGLQILENLAHRGAVGADLVLLAMGFTNPVKEGLLTQLGVNLDDRGNVKANVSNYKTSLPKIFAAGDMRRGQSLVVWAIREGRQAAQSVDEFLMGYSNLPR
jgi:glutamate synthase domain-containing protein 1